MRARAGQPAMRIGFPLKKKKPHINEEEVEKEEVAGSLSFDADCHVRNTREMEIAEM